MTLKGLPLAVALSGITFASLGAPYVPVSDNEVLLELAAISRADQAQWREHRQSLAASPLDTQAATQLVTAYLEHATATADARYVSYAQGVLTPWRFDARPAPAILVARAAVKQALHRFDDAVADLTLAIRAQPENPQARLMRANIHQVRGRFDDAAGDCAALWRRVPAHIVQTCRAANAVSEDQVGRARVMLDGLLADSGDLPANELIWCLHTASELAWRQGDLPGAARYIERALLVAPDTPSLLTAQADLLLEQRQYESVVARRYERVADTGLMVRVAMAAKRLGIGRSDELARELRARFAADAQRGDRRHLREEGMFALHVIDDPDVALELAQQNWAVQREAADRRLLIAAAARAGQPGAAEPVLTLLRNGLFDQSLAHADTQEGEQL